jgi:VCBS repeat-containing protein
MADSYATMAGTALSVSAGDGLLANDTDTVGRSMTTAVVAAPAHGTLSLAQDGSFVYTPAGGFSGTDFFTYIAADGSATSNETGVSINVIVPASTATVATKPVVKLKSRPRRTYTMSGAVRFAAKPKSRVIVAVQVQRYLRHSWRGYKTANMVNPASNYKTVVKLRSGTFRVRAHVSVGGKKNALSAWSKSFRVR